MAKKGGASGGSVRAGLFAGAVIGGMVLAAIGLASAPESDSPQPPPGSVVPQITTTNSDAAEITKEMHTMWECEQTAKKVGPEIWKESPCMDHSPPPPQDPTPTPLP